MMRSAKKTYEIDMLHGAILPKLLRFAVPLTLSTMLQLLFNAADVVVVGRWAGDNSLAAVGSNTSLIALLTNLFLGLSIGANILAARYFGAHEDEELSKTVHTSILLSLYSGVFLTVVGILGARTILIWMQCPANVLDLATLYLRIYFAGMTATMLYNFGAALLRASGDTQRPLYYLFASGVVNVILNLVFVIYFHMDVAGVALATVISQCISAALVVRCLMKETGPLRLDFRQLKIYPIKLKQIMQVGIPAGIQGMLFSLANVTVQSSVNSFGEVIMAGSSAAISIEQFIYSNINAFYQANVAFTSQNYGAGDYRRIKKIARISVVTGVVTTELLSVLAVYFGPQLLGIYSPSAEGGGSRHGAPPLDRPVLWSGRHHGCDRRFSAWRGVQHSSHAGHADGRLRLPAHLAVYRVPASSLPPDRDGLHRLSSLLGPDGHHPPHLLFLRFPKGGPGTSCPRSGAGRPYGRKPGGSRLLSTFAKQTKKPRKPVGSCS